METLAPKEACSYWKFLFWFEEEWMEDGFEPWLIGEFIPIPDPIPELEVIPEPMLEPIPEPMLDPIPEPKELLPMFDENWEEGC